MGVSENWPTYVLLSFYILAMITVTIIANRQKIKDKKIVSSHFLASKNFGSIILLLTTFASVFSGYTVVGVPNEAGNNGFTTIRWIAGITCIATSLVLIFPRIRRLSIVRDYESPGDFICDRFRMKSVKVLTVISLCVPQLFYFAGILNILDILFIYYIFMFGDICSVGIYSSIT